MWRVGPENDDVDIFAEHAAEIGDALAAAETDVLAEEQRTAAKVDHRRFEAHAGPQRLLFKEQGHHPAGQERLAKAALEFRFQVFGNGENSLDFTGREIGQRQQVSHVRFLPRFVPAEADTRPGGVPGGVPSTLGPGRLRLDDFGEDVAALVGLLLR